MLFGRHIQIKLAKNAPESPKEEKVMIKPKVDNVKKHFKTNKNAYISGAGCLVAGVVGASMFHNPEVTQQVSQRALLIWRPETTQMVVNFVENSTPSKPVHLVGTNLFFNSLHEAARETGHSLSMISRNVNGHIPDVKGDVFKLLERA